MPPLLFGALQLPFTRLGYILFPTPIANGIISGAFTFCELCHHFVLFQPHHLLDVVYDCMHYAYVYLV